MVANHESYYWKIMPIVPSGLSSPFNRVITTDIENHFSYPSWKFGITWSSFGCCNSEIGQNLVFWKKNRFYHGSGKHYVYIHFHYKITRLSKAYTQITKGIKFSIIIGASLWEAECIPLRK